MSKLLLMEDFFSVALIAVLVVLVVAVISAVAIVTVCVWKVIKKKCCISRHRGLFLVHLIIIFLSFINNIKLECQLVVNICNIGKWNKAVCSPSYI